MFRVGRFRSYSLLRNFLFLIGIGRSLGRMFGSSATSAMIAGNLKRFGLCEGPMCALTIGAGGNRRLNHFRAIFLQLIVD